MRSFVILARTILEKAGTMAIPSSGQRGSRNGLVLLASLLVAQACGGGSTDSGPSDSNPPPAIIEISTPAETDDGWTAASLTEAGLEEQPLLDALNTIRQGTYGEIHGLVVAKDGKLVLEEYGRGRMYDGSDDDMFTPVMDFDRDTLHILHSASKSVMSTLVGIAIRDGFIGSEEDPVLTWFPEHVSPAEPGKEGILLKHLMSMTSGLEWNEWDVPTMDFANNDAMRYQRAADPSAYFFDKALIHEPGSTFYYNTAGFQMMGEVIRRATGMGLDDYAGQALFMPLGIENFAWPQYAHGPVHIVGDILLRPRDMAKFGQLFLQRGEWNGEQVVPAAWIDSATAESISVAHAGYKAYEGYGFHWWRKTFRVGSDSVTAVCADGLAGQAIMVFPALDMVVVVTSGNYEQPEREHDLVSNYILPAALN
jgi:CubicO group peptidase (beta-lactamase class C family)